MKTDDFKKKSVDLGPQRASLSQYSGETASLSQYSDEHFYRESLYENDLFMQKKHTNVDCSSKILIFQWKKRGSGTAKGILYYVLKRELALPRKNVDFELERCAKERGGRAPRCIGSVPVAEMLARETRGAPPIVGVRWRAERRKRPL